MPQHDLGRVLQLVREYGSAAQICVIHGGQTVLDHAAGCEPDALFWLFSVSKPYVALLVHLLAERGALSLDDPVAQYWPQFAAAGKEQITVRQVLAHRSGLAVARSRTLDVLAMPDWDTSVRWIEQARPAWPPGSVPAYHYLSYGFILGELVRRVSGTSLPQFLAAELLRPLGLADTYLGLPPALWERRVPVRGRGLSGLVSQGFVNRREVREAVIPAAGVSATARDVARLYLALLRSGELDGVRVAQPATVAEARRPSGNWELDRFLLVPMRWSHGFQLGGPVPARHAVSPMGELSGELAFGHNGSNCCLAWADPQRDLVVAYLTDTLSAGPAASRHQAEVSDAVIAAFS